MEATYPALIGLSGAMAAIFANFYIQRMAVRREHRKHIAKLAADFLAHSGTALFNMQSDRREGEDPTLPIVGPEGSLQKAMTAGTELSLVGPRKIAFLTQALAGQLSSMILLSVMADDEEWGLAVVAFGEKRHELMQAVRRFGRAGILSDDQLGHDVIDADNPATTHTPLSVPR